MHPTIRAIAPLLALAIGAFAVSVDLHNDEVQAAVIVVGTGAFVLGAGWPDRAWRWALIIGAMVPIGDFLFPRLGLVAVVPAPFNTGAFLALIPAFLGVGAGVVARRAFGPGTAA